MIRRHIRLHNLEDQVRFHVFVEKNLPNVTYMKTSLVDRIVYVSTPWTIFKFMVMFYNNICE